MTTLEDALVARLADGGAVEAVIGQRVYPLRIPELPTGLPALAYQRIAGPAEHVHGAMVTNRERRFQLSVYDSDYDRGREAAATIIGALAGTRSNWGGHGEVTCRLVDDAEDFDPEPSGLFRQRIDLYLQSALA